MPIHRFYQFKSSSRKFVSNDANLFSGVNWLHGQLHTFCMCHMEATPKIHIKNKWLQSCCCKFALKSVWEQSSIRIAYCSLIYLTQSINSFEIIWNEKILPLSVIALTRQIENLTLLLDLVFLAVLRVSFLVLFWFLFFFFFFCFEL